MPYGLQIIAVPRNRYVVPGRSSCAHLCTLGFLIVLAGICLPPLQFFRYLSLTVYASFFFAILPAHRPFCSLFLHVLHSRSFLLVSLLSLSSTPPRTQIDRHISFSFGFLSFTMAINTDKYETSSFRAFPSPYDSFSPFEGV